MIECKVNYHLKQTCRIHAGIMENTQSHVFQTEKYGRLILRDQALFQFVPHCRLISLKKRDDMLSTGQRWIHWALDIWSYLSFLKDKGKIEEGEKRFLAAYELLQVKHTFPELQDLRNFEKEIAYCKNQKRWKEFPTATELQHLAQILRNHHQSNGKYFFFDPVYLNKIPHSCTGNVRFTVIQSQDSVEILVQAVRTIYPDEMLTCNFLEKPCEDYKSRQVQLTKVFGTPCVCSFCEFQKCRLLNSQSQHKVDFSQIRAKIWSPTMLLSGQMRCADKHGWCFWCGESCSPKNEVVFCSCSRVIYCSEKCKVAHWEDTHIIFHNILEEKKLEKPRKVA